MSLWSETGSCQPVKAESPNGEGSARPCQTQPRCLQHLSKPIGSRDAIRVCGRLNVCSMRLCWRNTPSHGFPLVSSGRQPVRLGTFESLAVAGPWSHPTGQFKVETAQRTRQDSSLWRFSKLQQAAVKPQLAVRDESSAPRAERRDMRYWRSRSLAGKLRGDQWGRVAIPIVGMKVTGASV
jgi:hypothetical protein